MSYPTGINTETEVLHVKDQKKVRILILVLTGLLAATTTALAGMLLYRRCQARYPKVAVAPDNVITSEAETVHSSLTPALDNLRASTSRGIVVNQTKGNDIVLSLYQGHADDSTPFYADNMFPGDTLQKTYHVQVSYKGTVTLYFRADIRKGYEKLAEAMKCRIVYPNGKSAYDGLMRDMPTELSYSLTQSSGATVEVSYDITVYLDTSVGNDYMDKELIADLRWWVDEKNDKPSSSGGSGSGSGQLIPPKTGDNSQIFLWIVIVAFSLLIVIALLILKKRKREENADE